MDTATLPEGDYKEVGYDARQVIDIDISQIVTECRAQILEDADGRRYTASFIYGVCRPVQYGLNLKARSVCLSRYQLIPYSRIEESFHDQAGIPLSAGSIYSFNEEAHEKLEAFDAAVRSKLIDSDLCHADETGINIGGKRRWLHCVSNGGWTCFFPHEKRGVDAMNDMGILPCFTGVLCHDHWKPYFRFDCQHALCNARRLRELQRAREQDKQQWAKDMRKLLLEISTAVDDAGDIL